MRFSSTVLASAGFLATANAALKGFNYGANFNDNTAKKQVDFEYEFNAAKQLPGTDGWTSARLYTMIQHGTQNTIIEAIQAAIDTQTTLLLGLWASAGQSVINDELAALTAAIQRYGTSFSDLVIGISVGSEDLYRITPTGIENNSGAGAQPQELVSYIQQVRAAIRGTVLDGKPIGHVDTWTAFVNATNNPVIEAIDFIGMDAYPYFQTTMANSVGSGSQLFFDAFHATQGASQGKPVWVTETGWPVSGQTLNQAEPSAGNARIYWEDVTCQLVQDNVNLFYYTLQDVQYGNPSPSFGIKPAGDLLAVQPLFDLSCPASSKPSSTVTSAVFRSGSSSGLVSTELSSTNFAPTIVLPTPKPTRSLPEPFEAPNLIVPIEKANPIHVVGDAYTAQLSPTVSTVFVFDVSPTHLGKTCTLVLTLPQPFDFPAMAPVHILTPGGISVSHLGDQTMSDINVNSPRPVGGVSLIEMDHQYNIVSAPCEAGQRIGYQADSTGGLNMNWFQMKAPALGLFLLVN